MELAPVAWRGRNPSHGLSTQAPHAASVRRIRCLVRRLAVLQVRVLLILQHVLPVRLHHGDDVGVGQAKPMLPLGHLIDAIGQGAHRLASDGQGAFHGRRIRASGLSCRRRLRSLWLRILRRLLSLWWRDFRRAWYSGFVSPNDLLKRALKVQLCVEGGAIHGCSRCPRRLARGRNRPGRRVRSVRLLNRG